MRDGPWTTLEARERAAFVLGVAPSASRAEARFGYEAQLAVHDGDSERERTARRTLMVAWAVWDRTRPDLHDHDAVDLLAIARDAQAQGLPADPHGAAPTDTDVAHEVEELLGSVEVVEVVRDEAAQQRLWHPVAGDGRFVVTDGRTAYLEAMLPSDRPPSTDVVL